MNGDNAANDQQVAIPRWLLAELTYRCPQQCPYCSNPTDYVNQLDSELSTDEWKRVLTEARQLGAVQLGFSGGEPCVRQDLEQLVAYGRQLGYYTNLITSGMGLSEQRIIALKARGLDHIQISFEASSEQLNNRLGGCDSFQHKIAMARAVKANGYPMVLNIVLHRHNIDDIEAILHFAKSLEADFVELANTQYYGWAFTNRDNLIPSQRQLANAEAVTDRFRAQHAGKMKVYFVVPDYYEDRPKRCANGWGTTFIAVTPSGEVLPCQNAKVIPGFDIPHVSQHSLEWIWRESMLFNHYRGTDWMQEPCRSCDEKWQDLGGCRCQAFLLTGDASATDPVCAKSTRRSTVIRLVDEEGPQTPLVFRNSQNSRALIKNGREFK